MTKFGGISLLLAAIVMSGCATDMTGSKYQIFSDPLDKEVAASNRSGKLYHQFDTRLIVDAIYNGKRLRNAWVKRVSETSRLTEEEIKRLSEEQNSDNERYAQFFVAFYTPDEQWDDLADPDSKWSVFLQQDTGPVRPESITKIDSESLPWISSLPFDLNFRTVYRVNFPREKSGFGALKLYISSLLGEVKLTWKAD